MNKASLKCSPFVSVNSVIFIDTCLEEILSFQLNDTMHPLSSIDPSVHKEKVQQKK